MIDPKAKPDYANTHIEGCNAAFPGCIQQRKARNGDQEHAPDGIYRAEMIGQRPRQDASHRVKESEDRNCNRRFCRGHSNHFLRHRRSLRSDHEAGESPAAQHNEHYINTGSESIERQFSILHESFPCRFCGGRPSFRAESGGTRRHEKCGTTNDDQHRSSQQLERRCHVKAFDQGVCKNRHDDRADPIGSRTISLPPALACPERISPNWTPCSRTPIPRPGRHPGHM